MAAGNSGRPPVPLVDFRGGSGSSSFRDSYDEAGADWMQDGDEAPSEPLVLPLLASSEDTERLMQETSQELQKLRASSSSNLSALRVHMEAQMEALESAESVLSLAAERVKSEKRALEEYRTAVLANLATERAKFDAELVKRHQEFMCERECFEQEQRKLQQVAEQQRGTVLLDVGGVHFKTSRSTLTSVHGSMLAAMFSGRHDSMLSSEGQDGRTFIDRDGAPFGYILNFLRDRSAKGAIDALPAQERDAVRREAHYFGLDHLIFPPNRRTIVLGGFDGFHELDSTLVLDVGGEERFGAGPAMSTRRRMFAAVGLGDCRVLAVGGYSSTSSISLSTTEVLDLTSMVFTPGPQMGSRKLTPSFQ
eukprot:TRINITY_DN26528_c0_g1_i2.p1 TRINITY_DN26528_c0_g1~~TRINITY_DN26528_c0_g1_i2.p1  ORF type:complete len:364 (+),score=97.81 TRINITY_DN26528_c0_g1_i2:50-1141(+)